jgi:hypothetical protein
VLVDNHQPFVINADQADQFSHVYRDGLHRDVLPFWLSNGERTVSFAAHATDLLEIVRSEVTAAFGRSIEYWGDPKQKD